MAGRLSRSMLNRRTRRGLRSTSTFVRGGGRVGSWRPHRSVQQRVGSCVPAREAGSTLPARPPRQAQQPAHGPPPPCRPELPALPRAAPPRPAPPSTPLPGRCSGRGAHPVSAATSRSGGCTPASSRCRTWPPCTRAVRSARRLAQLGDRRLAAGPGPQRSSFREGRRPGGWGSSPASCRSVFPCTASQPTSRGAARHPPDAGGLARGGLRQVLERGVV